MEFVAEALHHTTELRVGNLAKLYLAASLQVILQNKFITKLSFEARGSSQASSVAGRLFRYATSTGQLFHG